MSAQENKLALWAGYAAIAEELGAQYAVYDFKLLYPFEELKVADVQMAITSDPNFSAPLKYNKAVWICYADGALLSQFQLLVGPYGTFYVGDMQPFQPMQVVRCNKSVSIGRVEYSTSGPVADTVVNFVEALPIFMQFTREDIQRPPGTMGAQAMGRAITHWDAFIPGPQGMVKQDDVVVDEDGIKYILDSPNFTNMGYVCALRLATV